VIFNGTSYVKAQADTAAHAEVVGIVDSVTDANTFSLRVSGHMTGLSGLTAGGVYFLSPTTAGALTLTEPSTAGQISKPLIVADSATSGYFFNWRGEVQGAGGSSSGGGGASAIPGEVKMWPGSALPVQANYGLWVWADGAAYSATTYPIAAGNIAVAWKTAYGAADPGAGNFRVPDLRGVVPTGLDQMPGGARANRITRAAAAVLAAFTGEETHKLVTAEMPAHGHGVLGGGGVTGGGSLIRTTSDGSTTGYAGLIQNAGGDGVHENLPPTVFIPYIVKLDG
jgi:microcystin-dependent protein